MYELFILDDFFLIYKNQQFYFIKQNKNYDLEDIKSYIKFKYKINIKNHHYINNNLLTQYSDKFINDKDTKMMLFNNLKSSNSYYVYLLYIVLISVVLSYIYLNNMTTKEIIIKKPIVYETNDNKINEILNKINQYNISLEKIIYDKKYTLFISSKSKKKIYEFLNLYKKQLEIKDFSKEKKTYFLKVELAF
jgi:hypothetical protein